MDLRGRRTLVVGGGGVAERKIKGLLASGALVEAVSREMNPGVMDLVSEGRVRWVARDFLEDHLRGVVLVIAATDSESLNHRVSLAARARGVPVNAVDQPADCTFIVPAVVRRGDLVIAVSTSGRSPALARRVREELEKAFGSEYGDLLRLMAGIRSIVLDRGLSQEENSRIFNELVDSDLLERVRMHDWERAGEILTRILGSPWDAADVERAAGPGQDSGQQDPCG